MTNGILNWFAQEATQSSELCRVTQMLSLHALAHMLSLQTLTQMQFLRTLMHSLCGNRPGVERDTDHSSWMTSKTHFFSKRSWVQCHSHHYLYLFFSKRSWVQCQSHRASCVDFFGVPKMFYSILIMSQY